jgi:hypothetical protein
VKLILHDLFDDEIVARLRDGTLELAVNAVDNLQRIATVIGKMADADFRQRSRDNVLKSRIADQLFAMTDPIAERVRKLGGITLRSIGQISRTQRVLDNDAEYVEPLDMLAELADDNKTLATRLPRTPPRSSGLLNGNALFIKCPAPRAGGGLNFALKEPVAKGLYPSRQGWVRTPLQPIKHSRRASSSAMRTGPSARRDAVARDRRRWLSAPPFLAGQPSRSGRGRLAWRLAAGRPPAWRVEAGGATRQAKIGYILRDFFRVHVGQAINSVEFKIDQL